jgi:hypothetical protein
LTRQANKLSIEKDKKGFVVHGFVVLKKYYFKPTWSSVKSKMDHLGGYSKNLKGHFETIVKEFCNSEANTCHPFTDTFVDTIKCLIMKRLFLLTTLLAFWVLSCSREEERPNADIEIQFAFANVPEDNHTGGRIRATEDPQSVVVTINDGNGNAVA